MGKKLVKSESDIRKRMLMPNRNDILGIVKKNLGSTRMSVSCQDGYKRLCRIRGKMKRRVWMREEDVVLVSSWNIWSEKRGDIIWRYKRNQSEWLKENGYLTIQ